MRNFGSSGNSIQNVGLLETQLLTPSRAKPLVEVWTAKRQATDLVSDEIEFTLCGLEGHDSSSGLSEGIRIEIEEIEKFLRSILREEYWCRLESKDAFIHVGWDYYMYVGVTEVKDSTIDRVFNRGLFVEDFTSPYHPENCESGSRGLY